MEAYKLTSHITKVIYDGFQIFAEGVALQNRRLLSTNIRQGLFGVRGCNLNSIPELEPVFAMANFL